MDGRDYTWFGEVLYRILRSRGSSQSALAREARDRGHDYRQNSVSNWMRGVHAAPRDLPTLLDHLYDLSEEEWVELAVAFAYGQRVSREDLEDVREFRTFYRRMLEEEAKGTLSGEARKG
jgi:transcriptional regulator with XRE-family HTH domain